MNKDDVTARSEAPNVVMIVLDDLGYAQLGCYGSDIQTPAIDRLARNGLRYNRFHVTGLCSPTRACLLTGHNHHSVGMGFLADIPTAHPGYTGKIPASTPTLPRVLRDSGWSTMAVGKWHLAPRGERTSAGPFTRWPLGLGFERYYGFLLGDANHWDPQLVRDNTYLDAPDVRPSGYHLTEDLTDEAIRMVVSQQQSAPGKPFFLYFATGAMHSPHHVHREWADDYAGQFDIGWDAWREQVFARQLAEGVVPAGATLTERPNWVPAWTTLTADERAVYARMHEVYAGFLSHTDSQIDRLIRCHRQHAGTCPVRQRGQRRRGRCGNQQRTPVHPSGPRIVGRQSRPPTKLGWHSGLPALCVGLGMGRQHALPAVEAVCVVGGHTGPADRALAGRCPRRRRCPSPVRTRHRRHANNSGCLWDSVTLAVSRSLRHCSPRGKSVADLPPCSGTGTAFHAVL